MLFDIAVGANLMHTFYNAFSYRITEMSKLISIDKYIKHLRWLLK